MPKTKHTINDMSKEFLLHLFSNYLNFNTKLEVQLVCKLWKELIDLSFDSLRCLIICDYEMNKSRIHSLNMSDNKVSVIPMTAFHLTERTESKDRQFIGSILKKYQNLNTLCISLKYTKCNNGLFALIAKFCGKTINNLRLELSECSVSNRTLKIDNEEINQLGDSLPNLKNLYIDFVLLFIGEQTLQTLFTNWSSIETIIFHMPCFRGFTYNADIVDALSVEFSGQPFESIAKTVTKLEVPGNLMTVNAIDRFPDDSQLKRLFLMKLNLNTIETICSKFTSLCYFGFSIENNLNEDDLYLLMSNIGRLHELQDLYMAIVSIIPINHNCIKYLRGCQQIKCLHIDQTLMNREAIDALVKYFPKLEVLELWTSGFNQNFHNCLRDDSIENIQHLRCLKKLNFRGQRMLSDTSIAKIIAKCLKLKTVDIRTTNAAIITFRSLIDKSKQSVDMVNVYINETPISRLLGSAIKSFKMCTNLLLINEEFDYKIHF